MITKKHIAAFKKWLGECGAEVLVTTNPYEVVRYRYHGGTGIIYKRDDGQHTMVNGSKKHWRLCKDRKHIELNPKTRRKATTSVEARTIMERDGQDCFFCKEPLGDDITIEHLVAVAHGGPNHTSNKFLAHAECNRKAGHLSAPEKIALRDNHKGEKP